MIRSGSNRSGPYLRSRKIRRIQFCGPNTTTPTTPRTSRQGNTCKMTITMGPRIDIQNDNIGSCQVNMLNNARNKESHPIAISMIGWTNNPKRAMTTFGCEYLPTPNSLSYSFLTAASHCSCCCACSFLLMSSSSRCCGLSK